MIKIWNLKTAKCIKTLEGHGDGVLSIKAYQENFVISSSYDNTIKFWNLANGECCRTLVGVKHGITDLLVI